MAGVAGARRGNARFRRAAPVAAIALVAFGVGTFVGARHEAPGQRVAAQFTEAWQRGDVRAMFAQTDVAANNGSLQKFTDQLRGAERTATATAFRFRTPGQVRDGVVSVPATVTTRIFGTVRAPLLLPLVGDGDATRVHVTPSMLFPGLRPGEDVSRRTSLPPRASILARDTTPLAEGPGRTSPIGALAASIVGSLGPIPPTRAAQLRAIGVPSDAQVGISGLELALDDALRGQPGGQLLAGRRVLASRSPEEGRAARTSLSPAIQQAAVTALGGRLGGVVAMRPGTGEILAAAGIPFSGLQPPGSTMKIITLSGSLEAGIATPSSSYPYATGTVLSGVKLSNANGESCGGTLVQAFAISCNSVFAPLGAKLGARRFVDVAQRFGFNQDLGIQGAATPTIPAAGEIGDDLAVGASAIGQARVQSTALGMTLVAATIAEHGRRPLPTLVLGQRRGTVRAIDTKTANTVERLMEDVVKFGTGTAAAIPGLRVAGKTGTAELKDTRPGPDGVIPPPDPTNTDAWFVDFAPAGDRTPRVAVGVLLVASGAGGAAAAPVAHDVMVEALKLKTG